MFLNAFLNIFIYIFISPLFFFTPVARHNESALQKEEIAAAPQDWQPRTTRNELAQNMTAESRGAGVVPSHVNGFDKFLEVPVKNLFATSKSFSRQVFLIF